MSGIESPVVEWIGADNLNAPLIVLLHGWHETETDMLALVPSLPGGLAYASVRAPYAMGRGYDWFVAGRPFDAARWWFEDWLDRFAPEGRPVVLVGFSAGAAFAGGLVLSHPDRYLGAALLCGTLPFDAGITTPSGRLAANRVFIARRRDDQVIPHALLDRTWTYLTVDSGARVQAAEYEGGHGVSAPMLSDLALWLAEIFPPPESSDTPSAVSARSDPEAL